MGFDAMESPYSSTYKVDDMKKRMNVVVETTRTCVGCSWKTISRAGREDPRRVYHSFKVGISLTLVSLLYVTEPSFKGIGSNAMWAVMTVVVVLDFTAGATLFKGLNRGMGTLLAGSLAFLIEHIAQESGRVFHATFIGIAVFAIGMAATYVRFFPHIKKNYDYGVVIFISTFNLITISSFRVEHVLKLAYERAYTIGIGCAICLVMTLFIFPNWSGQYLHNSTASKLEGLAYSIQACVDEYFSNEEPNETKDKSEDGIYKGYKAVLDSKSSDETLALHASWEPRHSSYRLPWQQYVKLGDVLRHFSYAVVALHGCLQTEIQTPRSVRALFKDPCIRVATEVHKAVMELAHSIRKRRRCSPMILTDHLRAALQDLDAALNSQPRLFLRPNSAAAAESSGELRVSMPSFGTESAAAAIRSEAERKAAASRPTSGKIGAAAARLEFAEALPLAAFASLLVEAVARLDLVIEGVEELGTVANFRDFSEGDDECESKERGEGLYTESKTFMFVYIDTLFLDFTIILLSEILLLHDIINVYLSQ